MGEKEIRILVVEDDEGHAGLIRRAFSKASMATRLTLVDSVREASEFLGARRDRSRPGGPCACPTDVARNSYHPEPNRIGRSSS